MFEVEDIVKYRTAFNAQRSNAKARGIEFLLTFQEWCNWWGDDIVRRGTGHDKLQMQRFADTGPYALGNIRKGVPRENRATAGIMSLNRKVAQAAIEHQADLDRLMNEESGPEDDEWVPEEIWDFQVKTSIGFRYKFSDR